MDELPDLAVWERQLSVIERKLDEGDELSEEDQKIIDAVDSFFSDLMVNMEYFKENLTTFMTGMIALWRPFVDALTSDEMVNAMNAVAEEMAQHFQNDDEVVFDEDGSDVPVG